MYTPLQTTPLEAQKITNKKKTDNIRNIIWTKPTHSTPILFVWRSKFPTVDGFPGENARYVGRR